MIRFSCPACHKVIKAPQGKAGQEVPCPGCAHRLRIPRPPGEEADGVSTSDQAVLLGLATDAEREAGRVTLVAPPSRKAHVYAALSLLLGITALPVSVSLSVTLTGVFLAGLGVLLGVFAVFVALSRKRSGLGFAVLSMVVCASTLYTAVLLAGGLTELMKTIEERATKAYSSLDRGASACHARRTPVG